MKVIDRIKQFFESSTIHGLYYISSVKNWSRLFWILIVVGGFSGAAYLIHLSFDNWHQSPISTTIETLPISQITFPNVTVCPPKDLFLNLNYDILEADKVKLDKDKRETLIEASLDVIQDHFYNEMRCNRTRKLALLKFVITQHYSMLAIMHHHSMILMMKSFSTSIAS